MGTIIQEIEIASSQDLVWDAIRDVGEIHRRLVPGFVTDCKLEGDWRALTFANGMTARELIISVDDERKRHSWSARSDQLTHHNASVQVFPSGEDKCRVVWIADLMPNEAVQPIHEMIKQALTVMKQTLEKSVSMRAQ